MNKLILIWMLWAGIASAANINNYIVVPSGQLSLVPIISDATFARIAKRNNLSNKKFDDSDLQKLDKKFEDVIKKLKTEEVFQKIAKIAPKYGLKPESVAACVIGEHVFNVGLVDQYQSYFINIYASWIEKHSTTQKLYLTLLKEPDIDKILNASISDYEKWDTIFNLYNSKYRATGNYPDSNFLFTFFNPYGAGLTYGLGQLSPIRVLLTNDIAMKLGGLPKIMPSDADALYYATLDIDTNLNYVAASAVASINTYKQYSNFDISNNIGVIATLYNLGDEKRRALKLKKENELNLKENKQLTYPVENFYGWYMNKKENEIKNLFLNT